MMGDGKDHDIAKTPLSSDMYLHRFVLTYYVKQGGVTLSKMKMDLSPYII